MTVINLAFDMYRWSTEHDLDNLKDYLEMVESQFDVLKEMERMRIAKEPPGLSEEAREDWRLEAFAFEERYERDFPSKIRYSFVVLLFIFLETQLKAACDEISRRKGLELKEGDFKGSPLERATTFLKKGAGISVKENDPWRWITDLQKVRDCIVHTNGQINMSRDDKHLKKLCKERLGLSVEAGALTIERQYCEKSLEMMGSFFKTVFDSAGINHPS